MKGVAEMEKLPISKDPQTQNQVAGILLMREAEKITKIKALLEAGVQAHGDEFYAPLHDILFPNEPKWEQED
jgi:hypothetical protein